ncbi:hypothetical protein SBA2_40065 [Acidobacteriia bacterium SbA2]|nr:hypothetical protein SBA2_40065 [Acidobacteriia bacterium SbA2]
MTSTLRYGLGISVAVCVFGIANYFNLSRHVTCHDCFFQYGVPFTFFREGGEGGYAGIGGIAWSGVAGNVLVVVAGGTVLGWIWNRVSKRISS